MNKEDYIGQLIKNKRRQLRDEFDQQKTEYFNNLIKEKDKEIDNLNNTIDKLIKERDCLFKNTKIYYENKIERLKNELSIKTTYIEDLLKTILKSDDFKIQREVYEHGIDYDKKLKELKEGKENEKDIQKD